MNNNQGLENIKKQLLDFFSLKKEIGRMEFILYSIAPILLFLLFISILLHSFNMLSDGVEAIFFGVEISATIAPAVCLTIFSLQRLNSLKLNRNISYIFVVTALIILIKVMIAPTIEIVARINHWEAVEAFFRDLSYDGYLDASILILSFICIILIILLSLLKGIDE